MINQSVNQFKLWHIPGLVEGSGHLALLQVLLTLTSRSISMNNQSISQSVNHLKFLAYLAGFADGSGHLPLLQVQLTPSS